MTQFAGLIALILLNFTARPHPGPLWNAWTGSSVSPLLLVIVLNGWSESQFRTRIQADALWGFAVDGFGAMTTELQSACLTRVCASGAAALAGILIVCAAAYSSALKVRPGPAFHLLGSLVFFPSCYARYPGPGWVNDFLRARLIASS